MTEFDRRKPSLLNLLGLRQLAHIAVLKKVRYALCPMPYALCPMHVGYLMLLRKAIEILPKLLKGSKHSGRNKDILLKQSMY